MDDIYNKGFYNLDCGSDYHDKAKWETFFGAIADKIVEQFSPKTVIDCGCAFGYLVAALRDRGVEAYGFDISEYAISNVRDDIKQFCFVHSIFEPLPDDIPQKYDLVVTIEVLEHLYEEDGKKAIANICRYSENIIFTSTPYDIDNSTHYNVRLPEYWCKVFSENHFYHNLTHSVDFICPWALYFNKRSVDVESLVFEYELNRRIDLRRIEEEKAVAESKMENACFYFDCGGGFTEENKKVISFNNGVLKSGRIFLPNGCVSVRFDPVDEKFAIVANLAAVCNCGALTFQPMNSYCDAGSVSFFNTTDPAFCADISSETHWVEVNCYVFALSDLLTYSAINSAVECLFSLRKSADELCSEKLLLEAQISEIIEEKEKAYESLKAEMENNIKCIIAEKDNAYKCLKSELESSLAEIVNERDFVHSELISENQKLKATSKSVQASIDSMTSELEHYKLHYSAAINQREGLRNDVAELQSAYCALVNSKFWKMTFPARKVCDITKNLLRKNKVTRLTCKGLISLKRNGFKATWKKVKFKLSANQRLSDIAKSYAISNEERDKQKKTVFSKQIKFSVLVPLYNTPIKFLDEMIASVVAQTYGNWELCLADGSDKEHKNVQSEVKKFMSKDKRIKYKKLENNLGISENTNACIDMSTGDYIALFDHDDVLHPSALFEVMKAICEKNADYIYTDEATFLSPDIKKIITAHYKPDFAIDNLRANNYICHFSVFSREVLESSGKFRSEYDGSQDHDMILRLTANSKHIEHIPLILYYWRSHPMSVAQDINSKTYAIEAGKNAVRDSIASYGYETEIESSRAFPTIYRIKYKIKSNDLVSIIIPNKNHLLDLEKCVNSIIEKTTYSNYEIIIIDNGSDDSNLFKYYKHLKKDNRVKIISLNTEFNYSKLNNYAVKHSNGKYYVLLNNDIEIITPEWIEEMLMYAQRDDVAIVGAKLYYSDNTIQHAGIILALGADRTAGCAFSKIPRAELGYMGRLCYAQNLSAVTAACMMVKASVYEQVGGFDENLKVAYNDVDFCLKARQLGYLIVWTPYAEAYHYESKSRGAEDSPEKKNRFNSECKLFKQKWKKELVDGDPYYNPNFTLDRSDFSAK